jgi:hypothetical protein
MAPIIVVQAIGLRDEESVRDLREKISQEMPDDGSYDDSLFRDQKNIWGL